MKYWNNKGRSDLEAVILDRVASMKKEELAKFNVTYMSSVRLHYDGIFQTSHRTEYVKRHFAEIAFILRKIIVELL